MNGHRWQADATSTDLVDLLSLRAAEMGDQLLYRFEADDESELTISYAALERSARAVGAFLTELGAAGSPVLLLYPPGLEYITAFFGCLYAEAIAVPAYPPRPGRMLRRIETILADCRPKVVLTTASIAATLEPWLEQVAPEVICRQTDGLPGELADQWRKPVLGPESLALLQYTSGSTGEPKGVMVSHGNLLHNLAAIRQAFEISAASICVSWLPIYHDMGLVGCILEPLFGRMHTVLMSPMRFLQRPLRWLETVSKYRATHSGGPNFAYELCVERLPPEGVADLDLSHWQVAFCGSEPVRSSSVSRFITTFAPYGFRAQSFTPCYGLAEATLMVTSRTAADPLGQMVVQRRPLEQGHVSPAPPDTTAQMTAPMTAEAAETLTLIASGRVVGEQQVLVVDPARRVACEPNRVGEIWVQGPSVTGGYWNRPQRSAETFAATLSAGAGGPYLRTGDLGFQIDGQMFVTGRIKELVIVRGRKHYPQDLESTAQASHPALQPSGGTAFGLERDGREQVVLVHEVKRTALRRMDPEEVIDAICQAVVREHEVRLDAVALVRAGSLPRTSSGKLERDRSRQRFVADDFEFVRLWRLGAESTGAAPRAEQPLEKATLAPAEALAWIVNWLARRTEIEPAQIVPERSIAHYGLDSLMAVEFLEDVKKQLGGELTIGELVDLRSLAALAWRLAATEPADVAENADPRSAATRAVLSRESVPPPAGGYRLLIDRPDGVRVRGETPMRRIMPYLMLGRNESCVYHTATYDLTRTRPWLDEYNRSHPARRATLFDLFLWTSATMLHLRPGLNRFISGRRLYQRREVSISFAAKPAFDSQAPLATVKLRFPRADEPWDDCLRRSGAAVHEACHGPPRAVDRETQLALRLPGPLLRAGLWGHRLLDQWNLLPGALIENDPLYSSLFAANLGSLGLDRTFHHLYEYGNCSLFAAVAMPARTTIVGRDAQSEVRETLEVRWTLDERIADGFYSAQCLRMLAELLENPASLDPLLTTPERP